MLGNLRSYRADVWLPRFNLNSRSELVPALKKLGISDAFGAADFGAMGAASAPISSIVHQAVVTVDEAGTEAAAATAAIGARMMDRTPMLEFHADHPFLFVIRDTETDAILFLGRVVQPQG